MPDQQIPDDITWICKFCQKHIDAWKVSLVEKKITLSRTKQGTKWHLPKKEESGESSNWAVCGYPILNGRTQSFAADLKALPFGDVCINCYQYIERRIQALRVD